MSGILGISLGTRLIGLAVVYEAELLDFRVKKFSGVWSDEKRAEIMKAIERQVKKYGIQKVVVKVPKPYYSSQSITDLSNDLISLGERLGIRVILCTISTILRKDREKELRNKQSLIHAIVARYSDYKRLERLYNKEQRNHAPYYTKLFEAIACTEL